MDLSKNTISSFNYCPKKNITFFQIHPHYEQYLKKPSVKKVSSKSHIDINKQGEYCTDIELNKPTIHFQDTLPITTVQKTLSLSEIHRKNLKINKQQNNTIQKLIYKREKELEREKERYKKEKEKK